MASLVTERSRHIRLGNVGLVNLNTEASIRVRPVSGPCLADRPTRPEHGKVPPNDSRLISRYYAFQIDIAQGFAGDGVTDGTEDDNDQDEAESKFG